MTKHVQTTVLQFAPGNFRVISRKDAGKLVVAGLVESAGGCWRLKDGVKPKHIFKVLPNLDKPAS